MNESKLSRIIKALIDANVSEFKNGSMTMHFDPNGTMTKLEIQRVMYRTLTKKKPSVRIKENNL